jgi:uncharacterized membrane protein (Fun14 family)
MDAGNLSSVGASIGGCFFGGILIGYALKKVVKLFAIIMVPRGNSLPTLPTDT